MVVCPHTGPESQAHPQATKSSMIDKVLGSPWSYIVATVLVVFGLLCCTRGNSAPTSFLHFVSANFGSSPSLAQKRGPDKRDSHVTSSKTYLVPTKFGKELAHSN